MLAFSIFDFSASFFLSCTSYLVAFSHNHQLNKINDLIPNSYLNKATTQIYHS
jgi:hypothetical protein